MVAKFRDQTKNPNFVRDLQYQLFRAGELRFAEDLQKEMDDLGTAMENSPSFYHVVGLPHRTRVVAEAIMRKSWYTIEAPPDMFFVTSDCPVSTRSLLMGKSYPVWASRKKTRRYFYRSLRGICSWLPELAGVKSAIPGLLRV